MSGRGGGEINFLSLSLSSGQVANILIGPSLSLKMHCGAISYVWVRSSGQHLDFRRYLKTLSQEKSHKCVTKFVFGQVVKWPRSQHLDWPLPDWVTPALICVGLGDIFWSNGHCIHLKKGHNSTKIFSQILVREKSHYRHLAYDVNEKQIGSRDKL